jgi:tetratricopeptide (TPR) repeat protein
MQRAALLTAAVLALAGCHRREITKLERDQAASILSEAEFAVTLKEWPRAEGLYIQALTICPDEGDAWVNLGMVRMHEDNHDGARAAYKSAVSTFDDALSRNSADTKSAIHRAYVLLILGRADDARAGIEKARAANPNDELIRDFAERHGVDKMLEDPALKSLSP